LGDSHDQRITWCDRTGKVTDSDFVIDGGLIKTLGVGFIPLVLPHHGVYQAGTALSAARRLMDPRRIVEQGYDRIAARHAEWAQRTRTAERERYADVLLNELPAGASVLELGSGVGVPTTRRLAMRFRVTAVDLSKRQVEMGRRNVPAATFVHADMRTVSLPLGHFDAVAAFYSIIHVPREDHGAVLRRVAQWLRPDGIFLGSFGTSDTSAGYEQDWLGEPMFWSSFEPEKTTDLVKSSGLALEWATIETADEDGQAVPFLWVFARRRDTEPRSTVDEPTCRSGRDVD
jgi:SAM-dependent methyltransferase